MSSVACDKDVAAALADWGFEHLQQHFAKHKIVFNAFLVLDEDTLEIILPSADDAFMQTFKSRVSELGPLSKRKRVDSVAIESSGALSRSRRVTSTSAGEYLCIADQKIIKIN
ncbi:uncharacterized protein LOC117639188 [Thrips palmi]|uniref:Uncharacterized protein LOC117639188 n=1 Tax=Thrips palmi TaxID=161013 RepID=A0A6P8ZGQ4_THRPL|nr:uncharacterized protein LOC117639188 [Thrips palmi]